MPLFGIPWSEARTVPPVDVPIRPLERMAANSDSGRVLGVVVLARHGDRQGFYQNPVDYTASHTAITPLGNSEEFLLGTYLRALYLDASSPSFIQGVPTDIADANTLKVRADAGLYPATLSYNTTLANGTTIVAPLNGYQTIPVESVEPDEDISLEGWTQCSSFARKTSYTYSLPEFKEKAAASEDFLSKLSPYLDGRNVTLQNMWNIYDYMNVQYIHNATFRQNLPPTFLEQARDLANYHEYAVFTDNYPGGVGNIAGLTVLPSIMSGLRAAANNTGPKIVYLAVSYKPIVSLFNLTGAADADPSLAGIPNYAGALAFEVRSSAEEGGEPVIRLNFKNGTGEDFHTYKMLDTNSDIPISNFSSRFQYLGINGLPGWCSTCGETQQRGCAELYQWTAYVDHNPISRVGAGFLGAGLTLAVALMALGILALLGFVKFGRRSPERGEKHDVLGSETASVGSVHEKKGLH